MSQSRATRHDAGRGGHSYYNSLRDKLKILDLTVVAELWLLDWAVAICVSAFQHSVLRSSSFGILKKAAGACI